VSVTDRAGDQRKEAGKRRGKAKAQVTRINWRDPQVWVALLLILAVGFGGAYAIWARAWRNDMASEHSFYVASAVSRLRETVAQLVSCAAKLKTVAGVAAMTGPIVNLGTASARLEATLLQIPRRGPVQWKAEIIGLATGLQTKLSSIVDRQVASPDAELLDKLGEAIPALRSALEELDDALSATLDSSAAQAKPKLNLTDEVLAKLEAAIAVARTAADGLPE
jgi:hypothetical protein